jgi:anti-anti-sigma factor
MRVERLDGIPVAHMPADIDAANAAWLRGELTDFVGDDAHDLVLVLERTRFIDSAGLAMLFRVGRRLSERRAHLRVVIPADSHLRRLTQIVGLERAVSIYATVGEALAAARESGEHDLPGPGSGTSAAPPASEERSGGTHSHC